MPSTQISTQSHNMSSTQTSAHVCHKNSLHDVQPRFESQMIDHPQSLTDCNFVALEHTETHSTCSERY